MYILLQDSDLGLLGLWYPGHLLAGAQRGRQGGQDPQRRQR